MSITGPLDWRRAATIVVTLLLAYGSGYVMQNVLADRTPVATLGGKQPEAARVLRQSEERALPVPPAATLVPFLQRPPVMPERVREAPSKAGEIRQDARLSPYGLPCEPELRVTPEPGGLVEAQVSAPCQPGVAVLLRNQWLTVRGTTDGFGLYRAVLPAFQRLAGVTGTVGGQKLSAAAEVPDAEDYARVALVWEGRQTLRLHALEFGAGFGSHGHVWDGNPRRPDRAVRGTGGFLVRAGEGAEVYSFPARTSSLHGVVRIVLEAEVTKADCGREVKATAVVAGPLGGLSWTPLVLTMPDCSAVGQIVRLEGVLPDMRLAGQAGARP